MKIQLAETNDVDSILVLIRACNEMLKLQGIKQWDDDYPNRSIIENDITANTVFKMVIGEEIIGCVVLNEVQDKEYEALKWLTSNTSKNLVVHRLAVHPNYQGKGLAKKIMHFAEELAKEKGYDSVRLDTYSKNPINLMFYKTLNYNKVGEVFLPHKREHSYVCFEKIIE